MLRSKFFLLSIVVYLVHSEPYHCTDRYGRRINEGDRWSFIGTCLEYYCEYTEGSFITQRNRCPPSGLVNRRKLLQCAHFPQGYKVLPFPECCKYLACQRYEKYGFPNPSEIGEE